MNNRTGVALRKLGVFSVTLLVALCLYLLLYTLYGRGVLTLSGWLLRPFIEAPVNVFYTPQKGILLASTAFRGFMAFQYDIFSIGLNVIFAPALVTMTLGWRGWAWSRILASVAIMLLFHASEVTVTFLRFLTENSNPLIPTASSAFTAAAKWVYTFFDKMGYTLFPFVAWLVVCAGALARGFKEPKRPATNQDAPDQSTASR